MSTPYSAGYPLFVDGAFYPAASWREFDGGVAVQDAGTALSVSPAGGVFGDPVTAMAVTAPVSGLTVNVNAGYCSVPNTAGSGAYRFGLMQAAVLTVAANATGSTRHDYVVAGVNDIGSGSAAYVEYLTGTTTPPAQPANSILLAEVNVPNGAPNIITADITDLRGFVAAPGCILPVASAGVAPSGPTGQLFRENGTGRLLYSPVTVITQELTGSGNWTCPPYVTSVSVRATGGGGGGTGIAAGAAGTITLTASGSWTAPVGVTQVTVQAWGGGGGGGGSENYYSGIGAGGGGGGGGFATAVVPVTPGSSYTFTIGGGGAAGSGTSSGSAGAASVFTGDAGTGGLPVVVTGGAGHGGVSPSNSGLGGTGEGGAGGTGTYAGGAGAAGGNYDGGGGGGAGGAGQQGGAGGSPANIDGGNGGTGGGDGGNGGLTNHVAAPGGTAPGGGGGGSGSPSSAGFSAGGAGARGQIILNWTPDSTGGGGGGGGEYAYDPAVAVTPGHAPYSYACGAGGGASVNGGNTSFTGDTVTVLANGGQASSGVATGGAGGTGSMNFQHFPGGAGGTGSVGTGAPGEGGGGGASGTSTASGAAGGNATTTVPGAGGAAGPYGAAGGAGGNASNGASGATPGGGGGGSSGTSLGYAPGTGGNGAITLLYTIAPGAIPYTLGAGKSWYEYVPSGTPSSVSVTITADGTSDYAITAWASDTGTTGTTGTLQILDGATLLDSVNTVSSGGSSPSAHNNAGWTYITSGAQGTTLAKGTHTITFSSAMGLVAPAYLRVTQQLI